MPGRVAIKEFWRQPHTWTAFAECKGQFMKQKQPRHSKEYWILMRDLLATGVVTGVFESIESAIEEAAEWLDTATKKRVQVLDSVIIEAVEKYIGKKRSEWAMVAAVVDIHIPPKAIKNAIDEAVADGIIEGPKLTATQESLTSLGFRPFRDNSGTFVYRFIP